MMGATKRVLAGVLIATVAAVFCGKLSHVQGSRKDELVLNAQGGRVGACVYFRQNGRGAAGSGTAV